MKLNNKGFALTSIIYMLIVLFLLLLLLLLANLASRKVVLDKVKYDVKTKLNQGGINVTSQSLYDTLLTYYYSDSNPGKNGYKTTPGRQSATTNEGLIMSKDDSGDSYYFRGDVDNNYVFFAGKLFRIIRINGDGTIRLILNEGIGSNTFNESNNEQKNSGYTYDRNSNEQNSKIKEYLENWYNGTGDFSELQDPLINYDTYITSSNFCNDTSTYIPENQTDSYIYYSSHNRISPLNGYTTNAYPLLNCFETIYDFGGKYNLKVGLITADEAAFAGATYNENAEEANHYLKIADNYWTMTPETFTTTSSNWIVSNGLLSRTPTNETAIIRPVINLSKNAIVLNGTGHETSPYVISS